MYTGLVIVAALALVFAYTNGFHDSANAIATSISTRALTPRVALLMAAVMNLIGAFIGTGVAQTITKGLITAPTGKAGLIVVGSALLGAITWNLVTWYFGLPSSSSHALIGGLVGAALASDANVIWSGVLDKVILPMVISPILGFLVGGIVMICVLWAFRRARPAKVTRGFRMAQTLSAAAMALGHGLQDTQKSIGVVVLVLIVTGHQHGSSIPVWVIVSTALVMSLGTYAGGWRIMRTLGRKVIELDPPHAFAAELTASSILYVSSYVFAAPISTTHVMSAAIMGVGSTKRRNAVRWNVAGNIVSAWVLTMPAAGLVAAMFYGLGKLVIG